MKSFIISVLTISVFFIGLSALMREANARFNSDDKSLELISKAKKAIGGESNIDSVKSMTITGETEHVGSPDKMKGTLEISFAFPDRFNKSMSFGEKGGKAVHNIERIVIEQDRSGDSKSGDGEKDVDVEIKDDRVLIKKKDGTIEEIKIDDNDHVFFQKEGSDSSVWHSDDGKKVIIRKMDGKTEEIVSGDDKTIILRKGDGPVNEWKSKDGNKIIIERKQKSSGDTDGAGNREVIIDKGDGENKWTSKDGNEIFIKKMDGDAMHFGSRTGFGQNEFLQTTLALLMTPPGNTDITYKFLGTGDVDGKSSNIIEVVSKGSSFKLFLDASTNLPQMISYKSGGHRMMFFRSEKSGDTKKAHKDGMKHELPKEGNAEKDVEYQIRFSDFRKAGTLLLPHTWTYSMDGKIGQTTKITAFSVNPADIESKFPDKGKSEIRIRRKPGT